MQSNFNKLIKRVYREKRAPDKNDILANSREVNIRNESSNL